MQRIAALIGLGVVAAFTGAADAAAAAPKRRVPSVAAKVTSFKAPITNELPAELNDAEPVHMTPEDEAVQSMQVTLGRGYNSITETQLNQGCVSATFVPPDHLSSSSPSVALTLIKTAQQFSDETSFEASADTKFGSFSASASAKLRQTEEGSAQTIYLLVKSTVVAPNIVATKQKFSEGAKKVRAENADRFFQKCGDQFVDQLVLGAEFMGVFSYEAHDAKKLHEVQVHLEAAIAASSASADYKTSLTQAAQSSTTVYRSFRVGGTGNLPADDVDSIIKYALEFPATLTNIGQYRIINQIPKNYSDIDFDFDPLPNAIATSIAAVKAKQAEFEDFSKNLSETRVAYRQLGLPITADEAKYLQSERTRLDGLARWMHDSLKQCGQAPVTEKNCEMAQAQKYIVPAKLPAPIVTKLNVKTGALQNVGVVPAGNSAGMRLMVTGDITWGNGRETNYDVPGPCDINIGYGDLDGMHWVPCNLPARMPPGTIIIKIPAASNYDDNGGDLTAILY